jgi:aerobic carbon-monoxide dehydrogenase large subunit
MEIDVDTGEHEVRQFYALDDCGTRINPMVIEGQVHGGATEGYAIAMGQEIAYDEIGNVQDRDVDGFLPAHRMGDAALHHGPYETPSPHHPDRGEGCGGKPERGIGSGLLQRGA